ncbi:MAG: UDP-N-acetylmuramoyl-L-alanyl-D-glutamate--2,6-diaminopimelate ligase [Oscillospiraceae bacterium]|nr:UDP-N-acetylmuramoyl-L-alanyl-D-glutamate--2,6-diaminopimelate ligase [Oscillospiraceae bacterium]
MILGDLLKKTDILSIAADMNIEIHGVSFDSRTIMAGELFVAITGFQDDGHRYIGEAAAKGAVCVICEIEPDDASMHVPYVVVKDSRKSLADVSAAWFGYPADMIKLIGVTGTNGKTTVTALIKQVIEKCTGAKTGLIGTNGNKIGGRTLSAKRTTPESYEIHKLLRMMVDEGCKYAVIEVSSHALRLHRVHGIEFEVGVFTNLSPEHLDFHDTMEDYAQVKSHLFSQSRHTAINIDDKYAHTIAAAARGSVMTYSIIDNSANLVGKCIKLGMDKVAFCALTIGKLIRTELRIPGVFSVYNALAALSAAMLLGIDIESAASVLQTCEGVKGRAEVVPTGKDFTVLIDYAHTPDALENIIQTSRGFARGRVITLFGCGGDRDRKKRPLMGAVAARLSDIAIVTSDNPRTEDPSEIIKDILSGLENVKTLCKVIENRRDAICWALDNAQPGDVLILAGKGHETYQIASDGKRRFDEREVVKEYFVGLADIKK